MNIGDILIFLLKYPSISKIDHYVALASWPAIETAWPAVKNR